MLTSTRFFRYFLPLVLVSTILVACSPNARKQKFLARGDQDFQAGKYSEALISYGRALQLDPRSPEIHYKLGQTHLKMHTWASAYQELKRTVDLQPQNWKAQLALGELELAGSKRQEAKERALLILKNNPKDADAQMLLSNADAALLLLQGQLFLRSKPVSYTHLRAHET